MSTELQHWRNRAEAAEAALAARPTFSVEALDRLLQLHAVYRLEQSGMFPNQAILGDRKAAFLAAYRAACAALDGMRLEPKAAP